MTRTDEWLIILAGIVTLPFILRYLGKFVDWLTPPNKPDKIDRLLK